MDIVTTSLDALLQRATNTHNQNIDTAAVEAFCALVNKEKDGASIGVKLIATRIHSQHEKEALQTFHILDICMQRCGSAFQSEVGKFRFLNEMIKLVSPKYLGSHTPLSVKQKVLQLMYLWTLDYPKETKIKEAYDMLKKQGVIREIPLSVSAENYTVPDRKSNSIFQDEEKSKLLQKLLQSKNPEDLQAANRLIKSMVKEEDKRAEIKNKRISELEAVQNNVKLLNEMLDSYKLGNSSKDDADLIKELHQSCERLKANIEKVISEPSQTEEILSEFLQANDEMEQVFKKYTAIVVEGKTEKSSESSLLDFGCTPINSLQLDNSIEASKTDTIDVLNDIFTNNSISNEISSDILQPTAVVKDVGILTNKTGNNDVKANSKLKAFEELDALGENLMKQNLSTVKVTFNKTSDKIPMNLLPKGDMKINNKQLTNDVLNFDLNYLMEKPKTESTIVKKEDNAVDDLLVDITENANNDDYSTNEMPATENNMHEQKTTDELNVVIEGAGNTCKNEIKLSDIFVNLESIKPSSIPPVVALEEKNGLSVILNFAKDKPREDVSVVVVTILSKNESKLTNILFQAVVPKVCKLKLQPPSSSELPSFNPFLPPSAITQIMLIANPKKVAVSLRFIVSYTFDDETATEMGDIDSLPLN